MWMAEEWRYIANESERETCGHWWSGQHVVVDGRLHTWAVRCSHEGKFRRGYMVRCGYHTPGVGRKGRRRVAEEALKAGALAPRAETPAQGSTLAG